VGEGLLHVWPVTRSVTRLLTSDVSVVPLRLRRNAELRFVGHSATGRDTWDAVAGSKPSGRTWDLGSQVSECHPPVVDKIGADGGPCLATPQTRMGHPAVHSTARLSLNAPALYGHNRNIIAA
jgi:hypothetical protein